MKRTSKRWCKKLRIRLSCILDPDGWDRTNFKYSFHKERITKEEFIKRLSASTCKFTSAMIRLFQGHK